MQLSIIIMIHRVYIVNTYNIMYSTVRLISRINYFTDKFLLFIEYIYILYAFNIQLYL